MALIVCFGSGVIIMENNIRVLIISDEQQFLMNSIKSNLEETGIKVDMSSLKVQKIFDNLHEPDAILLYVGEDYEEHIQDLFFIRDKAIEEDYPLFLLGDEIDVNKIQNSQFANSRIAGSFVRPIDVKSVSAVVETYISENGRQNKKKILVVDDSGAVLRNVKGWLEDRYAITLANSGTTAIKSLSLNKPDLVLLDYEMPIIDGSQVLEMIRSEEDFRDIPVIFLTSKGDKESVLKVMALKPEGYLLKTLPPKDIIKAVDDFFERQKVKGI